MPYRLPKRFILFTFSAFAIAAFGCGSSDATVQSSPTEIPVPAEAVPVSTISETEALIWLEAPTGVHQTGWARVWEEADSLFVEVDVSPPSAVAQPAHIHQGQCSKLGVIDYRLENIVGGHSISEFEGVKLRDVATGNFAINLHASFADFSTFTACGEIPVLSGSAQASPVEPLVPESNESGDGSY